MLIGRSHEKTEWNERTNEFVAVARAEITRATEALNQKNDDAAAHYLQSALQLVMQSRSKPFDPQAAFLPPPIPG
jgi:hypothetical protein